MTDLLAGILQRVGDDIDRNNLPQILVYLKIIMFHQHSVGLLIYLDPRLYANCWPHAVV
jgi:hypothetical protein